MIKDFHTVYKENGLYYWCNCCGEITMPGDGAGLHPHTPEDLPPELREVYEKYQEEGTVSRYTVTFEGKNGVLLTALYDTCFVSEFAQYAPDEEACFETLMNRFFDYLCGKAAMLDFLTRDTGCTVLIGYRSDPDGHELSLFIPADTKDDEASRIIKIFDDISYLVLDAVFLKLRDFLGNCRGGVENLRKKRDER